jgi:ATP-binding cassette subfamily B protein
MSDWDDEDEAETGKARKRPLSNLAMLGFLWRQWMRDPPALWGSFILTLVAVGLDLCIPWASGRLVDAVAHPGVGEAGAWWASTWRSASRATASDGSGTRSPRATWRR